MEALLNKSILEEEPEKADPFKNSIYNFNRMGKLKEVRAKFFDPADQTENNHIKRKCETTLKQI